MEKKPVWLVYHKASLDGASSINFDGSEYTVGAAIIPAYSQEEAMRLFERFLEEDKMALLELYRCEPFDPACFEQPGEDDEDILHAASCSLIDQKTRYVGISSEAMDGD